MRPNAKLINWVNDIVIGNIALGKYTWLIIEEYFRIAFAELFTVVLVQRHDTKPITRYTG